MKNIFTSLILVSIALFSSCVSEEAVVEIKKAAVFSAYINDVALSPISVIDGLPVSDVMFTLEFSTEVDTRKFDPLSIVFSGGELELVESSDP